MARNRVVVGIFVHKPELTRLEEISLVQCWRVLGKHPIRLVFPRNMDATEYRGLAPTLQLDPIDPSWLSSYRQYERLKMSSFLYDRFRQYDFILCYELDSFVFRDDLLSWCAAGWDYIGAPWFEGFDYAGADANLFGVGNGGFSLRRMKAGRAVLRSWKMVLRLRHIIKNWKQARSSGQSVSLFHSLSCNRFCRWIDQYEGAEDLFWSQTVPRLFPKFRVAPLSEAANFAFEVNPRRLLTEIGRLPFGCHKWHKYDLAFWRPIIESYGFDLS